MTFLANVASVKMFLDQLLFLTKVLPENLNGSVPSGRLI